MKCTNCAFESEQEFEFCPMCGTQQTNLNVSANPAVSLILPALKDNLFLVICILITASTVLSIAMGGLPLLNILLSVFLWLVYASARKNEVNVNQLRNVSGTVYASYVIVYVVSIIVAIAGVIVGVALCMVGALPELSDLINEYVGAIDESLISIAQGGAIFFGIGFAIGILLVVAALILVNVFGMKKIHGLAKSVYQSVQFGEINLQYVVPAKNWLMVLGIISAVSAVTSIANSVIGAVSSGCGAAAMIIASILINKTFLSVEQINL